VTPPEGDPHPKTLKHLIAARRVAAVRPEQPVRRRKPCRGASSWHLFSSQPSRSGECTKLLSEVVDVEASHSSSDLDDDDVVGEDADAGDVDGDDVDRRSRCGSLEDVDGGDVDDLGDDSSPC